MLNFLRKLRRKEMKGSRYLKYAVGEIVLVVIGILIALRISDWNEKRKLDNQEKQYLVRLEADLAQIQNLTLFNPQSDIKWALRAKTALDYINNQETMFPGDIALQNILATHANLATLYVQDATYSEMLSNGAFSRIKNDSLKSAVSFAFKFIEDSNEYIDYFRQELSTVSVDIRSEIDMGIIDSMDFRNASNIFTVRYDLEELRKSRSFKNALAEVVDTRYDAHTMYNSLTYYIEKALKFTREELKKSK